MLTNNTTVYTAIAKKDSTWYLLLNGDALTAGDITKSKKTIQTIQQMMKKLSISHLRLRIEFDDDDDSLDITLGGKKDFTMKETLAYIEAWKA